MDSILNEEWLQDYYLELDAQKRMEILRSNTGDCQTGTEKLINTLWTARYGKKKPKNDKFVGCLMELKYISEGGSMDIGGQKKKQATEVVSALCLFDADKRSEEEQQILLLELKNAFLKLIQVSREGRGFTSIVFGMGQLSDEGIAKKVAEQISKIAFDAPHGLRMDREFAILQRAALAAFRQEYPEREHFLTK